MKYTIILSVYILFSLTVFAKTSKDALDSIIIITPKNEKISNYNCIGIHIGSGIVLTANHCIPEKSKCRDMDFISNTGKIHHKLECKKVLKSSEKDDYILIQLKEYKDLGESKVEIKTNNEIGERIFYSFKTGKLKKSICKISSGDFTYIVSAEGTLMEAGIALKCDSKANYGDSGSPVFDKDWNLVGVLWGFLHSDTYNFIAYTPIYKIF